MDKNKIIVAIIVVFIIALTFSENLSNNELSISSPNKTLKLNIYNENGLLSYSLDKNNKTIISPSLLGIETDQFKLISNLKISNIQKSSTNQEWSQIWGEQKTIIDNHNEIEITLSSNDNNINMIVRFRLFNDGL